MPSRRTEQQESPAPEPGTAVAPQLPDDLRAELLQAQAASIQTPIDLTVLKVLGSGVCLFELSDNPGTTLQAVRGIILHSHASNVLWDKPYGAPVSSTDEKAKLPACSSTDGIYGVPREGFRHAGLHGDVGDGEKVVECAKCPYNDWGSGAMVIATKNPKGKAVTNNRRIYLMLEGRDAPVELTLPPTSITEFDEYSASLLNKGIPLQQVVTEFSQSRKGSGSNTYAVVHARNIGDVDAQTFQIVMEKRRRYAASIFPKRPASAATVVDEAVEDEEIPF